MYWCYKLVRNYGLAIILFTLFSKIVLLPVTVWVQKNSIKMVRMMPDLNRIKIRHFGDKDTIADETSALYKERNYHPMASVIPVTLQIILLIGVISVIYHPLDHILRVPSDVTEQIVQITLDNNEELNPESGSLQLAAVKAVQADESAYAAVDYDLSEIKALPMNFLGFDLSWVASQVGGIAILVPVLAGLSAWLLSYIQNRINILQSAQSGMSQYGTMIFTVGLSLYLGFFVPAGVALYWIASNLMTILQQLLLNKVIDPKKYVDYEDLEATKKELASYEGAAKKKLFNFNDPLAKRENADYKRFFSIGNKKLVFYSERNGFYKYYSDAIDFILKNSDVIIHYITSDPNDDIFKKAETNDRIKAYYIGDQKLITLMMKMDADVVVMTMPDIETFQIKRSIVRKDVHYVYVPHGMTSLNVMMRKGSMDHYDSILVAGKHQMEEDIRTEEVYGLKKRELVKAGYPLLDQMIRDYEAFAANRKQDPYAKKTIMIAPSWQKDNIVDSCLDELLSTLQGQDYRIIVRPHPQHVRHMPERMEQLKQRFANDPDIEIQTDFSSTSSVYEADLLISDWSSIAYEFAFATKKPVLFINTPMKVMNPEWEKIGVEPFSIYMREVLGASVDPDKIEEAREKTAYLLENADEYRDVITKAVNDYIYNVGTSGEVHGRFILDVVFRQIRRRYEKASD